MSFKLKKKIFIKNLNMSVAENLAPSLGVVFACMMNAAPIQSLKGALAAGYLGSLNPAPWAFMFGNCLGWTAYSYLTKGEKGKSQ